MCGTVCSNDWSKLSFGFEWFVSRGGAALIAAIDLKEYNPMIISFGCTRAIVDDPKYPCTDLDRTRHFRFVNTNPVAEIEYDGIVMQRWPIDNVQVGHSILFDDQKLSAGLFGIGRGCFPKTLQL